MYRQWNRGITKGNILIMSLPQIKSQLKSDHKKNINYVLLVCFQLQIRVFFSIGKITS